jgi:putative lipoprotein
MMRELALVLALNVHGAHAPRDRWLGLDKAKHFFISAFVQSISFSTLRCVSASRNASLLGATAVTSAVGVGREIYDRRPGGVSSAKDVAWDAAGALAATALLLNTSR